MAIIVLSSGHALHVEGAADQVKTQLTNNGGLLFQGWVELYLDNVGAGRIQVNATQVAFVYDDNHPFGPMNVAAALRNPQEIPS